MIDQSSSLSTPRLKIRLAKDARDIDAMLPIFREGMAESKFASYEFSEAKVRASAQKALDNSDFFGWLIAEYDGKPIGYMHCTISEMSFATGDLAATIITFYIRQTYRKTLLGNKAAVGLVKATLKWAKLRGAKELFVHDTSEIDTKGSTNFFAKAGFRFIGANFAMKL